jgi:hypothetical protein
MPGPGDEGPTLEGLTDGDPFGFATKSDVAMMNDVLKANFDRLTASMRETLNDLAEQVGGETGKCLNTHAEAINSHAEDIKRIEDAQRVFMEGWRQHQRRIAQIESDLLSIKATLGVVGLGKRGP